MDRKHNDMISVLYWDNEAADRELVARTFATEPGLTFESTKTETEFLSKLKGAQKWDFILLDLLSQAQEDGYVEQSAIPVLNEAFGYSLALKVREESRTVPILFITGYEKIVPLGLDAVQPAFIDSKAAPTPWLLIRIRQLSTLFRQLREAHDDEKRVMALHNRRIWLTAVIFFLGLLPCVIYGGNHLRTNDEYTVAFLIIGLAIAGAVGASVSELIRPRRVGPFVSVIVGAAIGLILALSYILPLTQSQSLASPFTGGMVLYGSVVAFLIGAASEQAWVEVLSKGAKLAAGAKSDGVSASRKQARKGTKTS